MTQIILTTINARYAHASLGLRCLRANLGALRAQSQILEFVLGDSIEEMVATLLAQQPRLIGFGVYIWNVEQTTKVVAQLKIVAPHVTIVVGGPEVSYETEQQAICRLADYVVTGWGEVSFARLAQAVLVGPRPLMKLHVGEQPALETLERPYAEFSDRDIAQRYLYVEASRGCPYKCEFCLSALDKTAWPFPLEAFLGDMAQLLERGAQHFKFVDRTFNLKVDTSARILDFFLDSLARDPERKLFVHFELVPDHLPTVLKERIARFPAGVLQFEIGIQTWNPEVQALISRRQNNEAAQENILWLRHHTQAHLHVDLIAGLPGEDEASFARGFDRLVALGPQEIQLGILKRLRGAPIARHQAAFDLRFSPDPPYQVLSTRDLDFALMLRIGRFARYWDLIANDGRFAATLPLILGAQPYARFMQLTDALFARTQRTHGIALERLYELLHLCLTEALAVAPAEATQALTQDYLASGARGKLSFIDPEVLRSRPPPRPRAATAVGAQRQARHTH